MSKKPIANSWLTEPRVDHQNTVGETITQREHASDCDINVQIKRFQALGVSPHRLFTAADCADLSELSADLIEAHNTVLAAREAFDGLDDRVKQRFSGSPDLFLQFMGSLSENPDNFQEAVNLGLLEPRLAPSTSPPPSQKAASGPPSGASSAPAPSDEGALK